MKIPKNGNLRMQSGTRKSGAPLAIHERNPLVSPILPTEMQHQQPLGLTATSTTDMTVWRGQVEDIREELHWFRVGVFEPAYASAFGVQPQECRHNAVATRMLPHRAVAQKGCHGWVNVQCKKTKCWCVVPRLPENQGRGDDENSEDRGYFCCTVVTCGRGEPNKMVRENSSHKQATQSLGPTRTTTHYLSRNAAARKRDAAASSPTPRALWLHNGNTGGRCTNSVSLIATLKRVK